MKALVTGAAGFIGSHLVDLLLKEGHQVIGFDDLSTGLRRNVQHHIGKPNFEFVRGNVLTVGFDRIFPVDWVFHLAGKADLVPSIKDPYGYHETNVEGTLKMLQTARLFPVKKFLYAASSTCYGIPKKYPTDETDKLCPEHPYGLTKKIGEDYVLHWSKVYKIPAISLRLFNVYGPRARTAGCYGAMFGVFLAQLANGKPLTVVGDGTQSRDFTHVHDVARAFLLAAESKITGEAFNVGSSNPEQVIRIADRLKPKGIEYIPKRPGEPDVTWASTRKIKEKLGWQPRISLEEGILDLKEHLDDWKTAPIWDSTSIKRETSDWFRALS